MLPLSLHEALLLQAVLEGRHHEGHIGVGRVVAHHADAPHLTHRGAQAASDLQAAAGAGAELSLVLQQVPDVRSAVPVPLI